VSARNGPGGYSATQQPVIAHGIIADRSRFALEPPAGGAKERDRTRGVAVACPAHGLEEGHGDQPEARTPCAKNAARGIS